jgi:chromosome segregation ATPase
MMTDYSWLEPIQRETERIKEETERIREENKRLMEETEQIKEETERLREENKKLSKINVKEQFGHLPDGFLLSEKEINELRESKRELTEYAREKLKKLMEQEQLRLSEDDLGDLLWLVINYGDKLEKYPGENQVENLTTKLEKMLNQMG